MYIQRRSVCKRGFYWKMLKLIKISINY